MPQVTAFGPIAMELNRLTVSHLQKINKTIYLIDFT
jgi:hypothetical protein